jgi:hypothetical protein
MKDDKNEARRSMAAQKVTKNPKGKGFGIPFGGQVKFPKPVNRDGLPTFGTAQMLSRLADKSQAIKAFAL